MKKNEEESINLLLDEFLDKYEIPDDFQVNIIPLKHPQTGKKIYYAGSMHMDHWYYKKHGQTKGQIWPLCNTFFDPLKAQIHDDIKKELGGKAGIFTEKSSISKKDFKVFAKYVAYHDDPPCHARLNKNGNCPKCKVYPDMQSMALKLHCPDCDVPLIHLECTKCGKKFVRPE